MTALNNSLLIDLNRQGFIPGPQETEADFLKRTSYCKNLKTHLNQELHAQLGEENSDAPLLLPGMTRAQEFYAIEPQWIPLFFSNYQLSFWHGGCAWIFQVSNDQPLGALLQLRQKFKASETYLGLYQRDELIAHELAHVGRMAFDEPQFEEVFAYRTSPSRFRRWFGPIIQSSVESMLVLLLLGMILFVDISLMAFDQPDAYHITLWLKLFPLGVLVAGLWRLGKRHRSLSLCLKALKDCLGDERTALAVAYRLRDREIKAFGNMTRAAIRAYAHEQQSLSLRWRMIVQAYF